MTEADELSFHSWKAPGYDLEIRAVEAVLRQIRDFAIDGHLRLARGGIEVGGVLFGSRQGSAIHVDAWRPIACEHASGPSFQLSPKDEAGFTTLLEDAKTDPELQQFEPVGWFISHTRSGIEIRDDEAALWEKYFPESWQICLVVKPSRFQPVEAGYFFRDGSNPIRRKASFLQFNLPTTLEKRPKRERRELMPQPTIMPDSDRAETTVLPRPAAHLSAPRSNSDDQQQAMDRHREIPLMAREQLRPRRTGRLVWGSLLFTIAATLLGLVGRLGLLYYQDTHKPTLGLRVMEENQELRIRWDKDQVRLWEAKSGEISFKDGASETLQVLDADALKLGAYAFVRQSGEVQVQVKVFRVGKSTVIERARFIGPVPNDLQLKAKPPEVKQARPIRRRRRNADAPELDVPAPPPTN